MWKRISLDRSKSYKLQLCQSVDANKRFCRVEEFSTPKGEDVIFETGTIPIDVIEGRRFKVIAQSYLLTTGQSFVFGPHGEWYTEREIKSLMEFDIGVSGEVCWETTCPPNLPIA